MRVIEFDRFSFSYKGSKRKALDSISLAIQQGEFIAVTGPSGAGKTTLTMAISGLVPHYFGGALSGTAQIAGKGILEYKVSELALKVGTVLEDYESQLVTMTAADEIAFGLENRGIAKEQICEKASAVLEMVGLAGKADCEVASLSGGQKQRLAIAAVLATDPEILVLDEPASALDPEGTDELYALLAKLNREQKITIVVVEHDISRILPCIDQLVLMEEGKIEKAGTVADTLLYLNSRAHYREALPALWELKLALDEALGYQHRNWLTEEEALQELSERLPSEAEVVKSA